MPQPNTREQPCPPAVTRNRSDFSQRSSRLHSWFTVPLTESFLPFLLASAISATSLKAEVSRSRQTTSLSPMLYTACLSHGHHANSGSSPTWPNFVTTSSMYQARRMWWQMLCPGRPPPTTAPLIFFTSSGVYSFTSGSGPCTFNLCSGLFTLNRPACGQCPRLHTAVSECIKHASTSCSSAGLQ